jgi:hypothetical protein
MRTIYAWANDWPEFEDAVEHAWHLLHAYWARLLRENISNPAFRQTAALKVMAKRFPATWGEEPRNTLETFMARNSPAVDDHNGMGTCPKCSRIRNMTNEELSAEIDVFLERRKISYRP